MITGIKSILVTGSSGTIGTRLCEELLQKGYHVVGFDLKHNKWQPEVDKVTIIGDLRKKHDLEQLKDKFDLIIHLAANARVYHLVKHPSLAKDNFETLFNVLEFMRARNMERIVFASSREVYGNSTRIVHNEEESYVKNCESPYTATKIGGEALIHSYRQCYGIAFIIARFSNVYGMYDESERVIPAFIRQCKANKDLVIFGKDKLLDFTFIDDCITGILAIVNHFDKIKNNTINVATGKGVSIFEIAEIIKKEMNSKSKILTEESRTGEVIKFIANIDKAKYLLGYEPKIGIEEGIKKAIAWDLATQHK